MRKRFPYKPLSEQRGLPWPHPPGSDVHVRRSATIKTTAPLTVEVKAVKGAVVYSSDDMPIPEDQFIHVELTPHIARAIREGDLKQRPRPARRKPTAKAAAVPSKAGNPVATTPAKKPTKQAAKMPTPARGTPKSKPAKEERPPTLRQQMIIHILRGELGDDFSADDIAGKTKVVRDGWKAESMAPLGNASRPVVYSPPDRMTVTRTIRDYLKRPRAYLKRS
jgi:hypothetical protein